MKNKNSFILEHSRRDSYRRREKIRRLKKEHQFWRQVALLPAGLMTLFGMVVIIMVVSEKGWDGSVTILSLFVGYMGFEVLMSFMEPPRDTAFDKCFGEDKK